MPDDGKVSSTRMAIVERSLADSIERLRDHPPGPRVRELRAKADGYQRALRGWSTQAPSEEQRSALLKLVLDLNVEVMSLSRGS